MGPDGSVYKTPFLINILVPKWPPKESELRFRKTSRLYRKGPKAILRRKTTLMKKIKLKGVSFF